MGSLTLQSTYVPKMFIRALRLSSLSHYYSPRCDMEKTQHEAKEIRECNEYLGVESFSYYLLDSNKCLTLQEMARASMGATTLMGECHRPKDFDQV